MSAVREEKLSRGGNQAAAYSGFSFDYIFIVFPPIYREGRVNADS